jgi:ACT domain-containing protein
MYGFPTQTAQETIDSLEMVRQLFEAGILQSAFWHQFTMTAHSPVGLEPEKYKVKKLSEVTGSFANNDIEHTDPTGADHPAFSFGLKKSLLNYMHGACFEYPLQKWFEFKVPKTSIPPDYIVQALEQQESITTKPGAKITWLGKKPQVVHFTKSKKGNHWPMTELIFQNKKETVSIKVNEQQGDWLAAMLEKLAVHNSNVYTLQQLKENYEANGLEDFELFWDNKPVNSLYRFGLLQL